MSWWLLLTMALTGTGPATAIPEPEAQARPVTQEVVGLELTPVSLAFGSTSDGRGPQRARVGLGGMLRFGRHRWDSFYWTPVQAGLFLAGADFDDVISARIQTEVGGIFRFGGTALEAGLAAGPGILAVTYPGFCDGSCTLGGTGLEISPVLRYLFRTAAPYTVGAVLRAEIPVWEWSDSCFNTCTGRAVLVLGGIEAAFHWPGLGR